LAARRYSRPLYPQQPDERDRCRIVREKRIRLVWRAASVELMAASSRPSLRPRCRTAPIRPPRPYSGRRTGAALSIRSADSHAAHSAIQRDLELNSGLWDLAIAPSGLAVV